MAAQKSERPKKIANVEKSKSRKIRKLAIDRCCVTSERKGTSDRGIILILSLEWSAAAPNISHILPGIRVNSRKCWDEVLGLRHLCFGFESFDVSDFYVFARVSMATPSMVRVSMAIPFKAKHDG